MSTSQARELLTAKEGTTMHRPQVIVLAILSLSAGLSSTNASGETVAFTSGRWDLKDAVVQRRLDRQALSGTAWLKDMVFTNGTIEADVATNRERSYPAPDDRWVHVRIEVGPTSPAPTSGLVPETNLLVVPSLYDQRLTAYTYAAP